jgi:hypothetical protein
MEQKAIYRGTKLKVTGNKNLVCEGKKSFFIMEQITIYLGTKKHRGTNLYGNDFLK